MNKTFVVLALAGLFASSAGAQSKVELYGSLEGGVQSIIRSDIDGVAQPSTFGLAERVNIGSYFGLRGSEALGGGNRLVFALESGFNLDTGSMTDSGRLFNRQAYLGFQNRVAKVALGRFGSLGSTASDFDLFRKADPFKGGFGDAGLKTFANYWGLDNALVLRTASLRGVTASAMYSFAMKGPEAPGMNNNDRYAAIGANYAVGKLWSALIYETKLVADGKGENEKIIKAALNYDFGLIKPFFAYSRAENFYAYGAAVDSDSWMLGLTAPVAGGLVRASWQFLDGDERSLAAGKFAAERTIWALGYSYNLSKRTIAWGVATHSVGGKSLDADSQAGYVMSPDRGDVNRSVFTLGLTHRF